LRAPHLRLSKYDPLTLGAIRFWMFPLMSERQLSRSYPYRQS
jgi:hypothetical protein